MNQGKYVFAQLIEFLSHNDFIRCVSKYEGNYKVKPFTSWHQLLQILSISLLCKIPLSELFSNTYPQYFKEQNCNQLKMFDL